MAQARARVRVPRKAKKGEILDIKTLIQHRMETGYRVDSVGRNIPRDIITKMTVTYAGAEVFTMDFTQGVSANPFVAFALRAERSGELVFAWENADATLATVRKTIKVME